MARGNSQYQHFSFIVDTSLALVKTSDRPKCFSAGKLTVSVSNNESGGGIGVDLNRKSKITFACSNRDPIEYR